MILEYQSLLNDPWVLKETTRVATSVSKTDTRRTAEEVWNDTHRGYVVEHAVFLRLESGDYEAVRKAPSHDKTYDIDVLTGEGLIFIDVKTCFPGANSLSLGRFEFQNARPSTVYMYFQIAHGEAMYIGYATRADFKDSKYQAGTGYVFKKDLNPDLPPGL